MTSCVFVTSAVPASAGEKTVSVHVTITNLRNVKGLVHACMSADPERFTRCEEGDGSYQVTMRAADGRAFDFENVVPGTYAIALLHDENENDRVDRFLSMIPREGFGFSRDAPVSFGPPDFEDAAFDVGVADVNQTIRMRYLL
jgi:uncharacterized protein (DUF2141 family)